MPIGKPTKLKPCSICGDMFLPEKPSSRICSKTHYASCPVCGKMMVWNTTRTPEPCSKECRKELTRRKNLEKYGVEHPMQNKEVQANHKAAMKAKYGVEFALQNESIKDKMKQTNTERFGTEWVLQNKDIKAKALDTMKSRYGATTSLASDVLSSKIKHTMTTKYGANNPMQIDEFKDKAKNTLIDKYGVDNAMKVPEFAAKSSMNRYEHIDEIKAKAKETSLRRYGVDNPAKSAEVKSKIRQTMIDRYGKNATMSIPEIHDKIVKTNMERYGVPYYYMTDDCKSKQGNIISKRNREFGDLLKSKGVTYKFEHRIQNYSYDIYIPDHNTLIEVNPSYTHNVIGNYWGDGIDERYHLMKTQVANDNGYRCIHIFDWDDFDKISEMLKPRKRVYARKCQIYYVKKAYGDEFLRKYHLQGTCRGQGIYAGLVYNGELIQLMTIGRPRYTKKYQAELLRLCTKPGYTVIGGASKLFKWIINTYEIDSVISYCDKSKFTGDVYEKIGMKLDHITPPQEVWSYFDKKITANLLRQRGFDQLFGTDFGKGTNNEELMLLHGWVPVYDCGQIIYVYK